jgi:hypothetical protein
VCVDDKLAAYCLDAAVTTFGTILENALAERVNVGDTRNPRYEARYQLSELLDADFHLPQPDRPGKPIASGQQSFTNGVAQVLALAQQPNMGVKRWVYVGPEPKPI